MAEQREQSTATADQTRQREGARPLDEAQLDQVAGGKRTNVQDAHDKHANQEINYTGQ